MTEYTEPAVTFAEVGPADALRRIAVRARIRRARDFVVAAATGTGLAALSYAMLTRPAPQSISPFYLQRALPEGALLGEDGMASEIWTDQLKNAIH